MLEVKRLYDLDLNDPFFDSFKKDYKFEDWCSRNKDRKCYVSYKGDRIDGLLVLKIEDKHKDFDGIYPALNNKKRLKVCTFKVVRNYFVSKKFIELIFNTIEEHNLDEIYFTIYNNDSSKEKLIKYLNGHGFNYYGLKYDKEEVYVWKKY